MAHSSSSGSVLLVCGAASGLAEGLSIQPLVRLVAFVLSHMQRAFTHGFRNLVLNTP